MNDNAAEILNQVLNKEVKISVDKYNQFSLIPTLYNLFGNLYINGIDQLYKNKRFTKENKYQLIANKINPILSKINQLNKEKNYNEARSYQYYRNLDKNNFNEFELLKDTLSKIPADFNAQILYYKLATSFDGNEDISKKFERLNEAIKLYPNLPVRYASVRGSVGVVNIFFVLSYSTNSPRYINIDLSEMRAAWDILWVTIIMV